MGVVRPGLGDEMSFLVVLVQVHAGWSVSTESRDNVPFLALAKPLGDNACGNSLHVVAVWSIIGCH